MLYPTRASAGHGAICAGRNAAPANSVGIHIAARHQSGLERPALMTYGAASCACVAISRFRSASRLAPVLPFHE
jgi:hypothetical protein